MLLSNRELKIINLLKISPRKIEEMAEILEVTPRTIRNNLDSLNIFLKKQNFQQIKKNFLRQYEIDISDSDLNSLFKNFTLTDQEERQHYILLKILLNKFVILSDEAKILNINRSVLKGNINFIKKIISYFNKNININTISSKGSFLSGNEDEIRYLFYNTLYKSLNHYNQENPLIRDLVDKCLEHLDVKFLHKLIKNFESKHHNISKNNINFITSILAVSTFNNPTPEKLNFERNIVYKTPMQKKLKRIANIFNLPIYQQEILEIEKLILTTENTEYRSFSRSILNELEEILKNRIQFSEYTIETLSLMIKDGVESNTDLLNLKSPKEKEDFILNFFSEKITNNYPNFSLKIIKIISYYFSNLIGKEISSIFENHNFVLVSSLPSPLVELCKKNLKEVFDIEDVFHLPLYGLKSNIKDTLIFTTEKIPFNLKIPYIKLNEDNLNSITYFSKNFF